MSHAGLTREQLEVMRKNMVDAERAYRIATESAQRSAIGRLQQLKVEIEGLVYEAEALADSVDLKFYYSSGYDEFTWSDADNWSSSSAHC